MSISSNKDFTDISVAKSYINKSLETGLEKDKNKDVGASILKIFKNLWHKTEVTFRQICNSFEEGWITNETIKNRLITKIGECKDEIDDLSRKLIQSASNDDADALLQEMSAAKDAMANKVAKMEDICRLFRKRGDRDSAEGVEKQLQTLHSKIDGMLDPLNTIKNLKSQIGQLASSNKELKLASEKLKQAEEKLEKLEIANPELAKLHNDLNLAELQRTNLEIQLTKIAAEKEREDSQRKEIENRLNGLNDVLSQSNEQIKQFISDNVQLKKANQALIQALEQAQIAEKDYKKLQKSAEDEREDFLRLSVSSLSTIESQLRVNERKLKDKDKTIAEKDIVITDLENQLAETKAFMPHTSRDEVNDNGENSKTTELQQQLIFKGKQREKESISDGSHIEILDLEDFPRVTDVTQLDKLNSKLLNFISVAEKTPLVLDDTPLNSIYKEFKRYDEDALSHAADFFKEIEGRLVRIGMAKWNENKTGIKIKKDHPEVAKAYGKALKAFYKIDGAPYFKEVLPHTNEQKQRDAEHLRSQREKIELIETHFVSNLEDAITSLGNAMQELVCHAEENGLPVKDIETMAKGPWDFEVDTVDQATQIFNEIEMSLVKRGMAQRGEKRMGVTVNINEYPKLQKAYENALTVFDSHIDALHAFYIYDDLIYQNNEKLLRLIVAAEEEKQARPLNSNFDSEDLSHYTEIVKTFVAEGIEMSDNNLLEIQREVLQAIKKRYGIENFPPNSNIAKLSQQAEDGINNLEFTKKRHEGFKRGVEISPEKVKEQRIEERTQKFEREFPAKKIKKSISEQPEKPIKTVVPASRFADYESRSADVQFKDPRITSKDQRMLLKKENEQLKQEVEGVLNELIQAAEAHGLTMANPMFKKIASDPLQILAKFKKKGLRIKNDSMAVAARKIFDQLKQALEDAGIDQEDLNMTKVSNLLEKLNKREENL